MDINELYKSRFGHYPNTSDEYQYALGMQYGAENSGFKGIFNKFKNAFGKNKAGASAGAAGTAQSAAETAANTAGATADAAKGAGISGMFKNLKTSIGNNFGYSLTGNPKTKYQIGTPKGAGVTAFGLPIGKYATIANGVMGGVDALSGISKNGDITSSLGDLEDDILVSAANNPIISSYLTGDQLSLLNKLKSGNYDDESSFGDYFSNVNIGDALQNAVSGAMLGGIPGAIVGAVSGLANGAIDRTNEDLQGQESELLALLQAVNDAESQYKAMKRPNFTGLGIQQQYQNMYA